GAGRGCGFLCTRPASVAHDADGRWNSAFFVIPLQSPAFVVYLGTPCEYIFFAKVPHNQADLDEIGVRFSNLPARHQLQVLAEVALFVCLHAQVNSGLASLNALQLTLITRIMRLAASHPLLMPDSAFIDQLFREAKSASFERKLASAFQQCLTEVAQPS